MSQSVPVQTTCPCSKKSFKDFKRHSKSKTHEKWVQDTTNELLPLLTPIDQLPAPPEWMLKDEKREHKPTRCYMCKKCFKYRDEYNIDEDGITVCNPCYKKYEEVMLKDDDCNCCECPDDDDEPIQLPKPKEIKPVKRSDHTFVHFNLDKGLENVRERIENEFSNVIQKHAEKRKKEIERHNEKVERHNERKQKEKEEFERNPNQKRIDEYKKMEEQLSLRYEKLSVLKIPTMIALKKICKTKLEYEKELDKVMKEYNDILISTKFSLRGVLDENYMSEECKKLVSYSNNSQRTYRDTFRRRQKEIQKLRC